MSFPNYNKIIKNKFPFGSNFSIDEEVDDI
jgi:hypothetical protein